MTKTFCDACGIEIKPSYKRCEFAISWEVSINIQNRQNEYEICLHCANEIRSLLKIKQLQLDKKEKK